MYVIDTKPRESLTEGQKSSLKALAKQVMSQLELRKKNLKLEIKNKEISRLNEELNNIAYKLTHDLKTPIRGILSLAEFIKQDISELVIDAKVNKCIDLITSRAISMESMIEELLAYTEVTNTEINYEDFNLRSLIESVLKSCDLKNEIVIDLSELSAKIVHSKICFMLIFKNLLINSKRFSNHVNCEVEIKFIEKKDSYQFIYVDNGPGIPKKYQEKIFIMFETLDTTNFKNNGIGLATVKSIITRLGGNITVKKRDDNKKGACFEFRVQKSNFYEKIAR